LKLSLDSVTTHKKRAYAIEKRVVRLATDKAIASNQTPTHHHVLERNSER